METISDAKLNIVIKYNVKARDFMSLGRVFLPCVRDFLSHERDFQSEASGYVGVASGHMGVTSGNECVTAGHVGLSPKQFFISYGHVTSCQTTSSHAVMTSWHMVVTSRLFHVMWSRLPVT